MEGFYLLCGHLLGDYIVQNDWMAANKTRFGKVGDGSEADQWRSTRTGHIACTAHCLLYTAAVALCSFWWMPWWGYVACFGLHWVIDRFRLAGLWMRRVSGQASFADGPLAPWSIVVVDNTIHLLTLAVIAAVCGR